MNVVGFKFLALHTYRVPPYRVETQLLQGIHEVNIVSRTFVGDNVENGRNTKALNTLVLDRKLFILRWRGGPVEEGAFDLPDAPARAIVRDPSLRSSSYTLARHCPQWCARSETECLPTLWRFNFVQLAEH